MNETYLEPQNASYSPAPKRGMGGGSILSIVLGLFSLLLLCALAGVGYWAYTLNTDLTNTQKELADWKAKYDTLTTEKNKLATDLDQTKSKLASTESDLASTRSDLESARSDAETLQAKIDKAREYAQLLVNIYVKDQLDNVTGPQVKAIPDPELNRLWDVYIRNSTSSNAGTFLDYLFQAVVDALE